MSTVTFAMAMVAEAALPSSWFVAASSMADVAATASSTTPSEQPVRVTTQADSKAPPALVSAGALQPAELVVNIDDATPLTGSENTTS